MDYQKLLIATFNLGKFREYKIIFKEILKLPLILVSLNDLKIGEKVEEGGKNYEENAALKARFYCKASRLPTLADDSGLEIAVLGGWPGIKSRRDKNGKELSDKKLIAMVIKRLKGFPLEKRKARYRVVVAISLPEKKKIYTFEGKREGLIAQNSAKKIWKGFPFDSVFYLPQKKNVFVKLTPKEKAEFSHRFQALKKALPILKKFFNAGGQKKAKIINL